MDFGWKENIENFRVIERFVLKKSFNNFVGISWIFVSSLVLVLHNTVFFWELSQIRNKALKSQQQSEILLNQNQIQCLKMLSAYLPIHAV